jgi:hypothetical protein
MEDTEQFLDSRCTIENCLVFNRGLILLCTTVFFNVFVVPKRDLMINTYGNLCLRLKQPFGGQFSADLVSAEILD